MRTGRPVLALTAALLLGGCVYDPYTGGYMPCCNYYGPSYGYGYHYPPQPYPYGGQPAPYYGAPAAGQPGGYYNQPQGQPGGYYNQPQGQPGEYYNQPQGQQPAGQPGASAYPAPGGVRAQRFAAANVTHDGRLTREQAQAAMPMVAQNFDAIDMDQKGYVTLPEIRSFAAQRRSDRSQSAANGQN